MAKFRYAFRALGRRDVAGSVALTLLFVCAAAGVHFLVRWAEGLPIEGASVANIFIEMGLVGGPTIFYARYVIAALKRSRAQMGTLSRRLATAVEQAEQASRAKSAFLANMSHELRTPLNAILGFSEIMKDQHLGPVHNARYLSYSRDIHSSGRHLLGIINDVLDLAKIESGKMTLEDAEEFELTPSIAAALTMVSGLGEKYGVALTVDLPQTGIRLIGAERMLRQIVINLAGNAIKFTPEGGSVTVHGSVAPDGRFVLTVRDSGVGMSEIEIANALVPFGQNATAMSAKHTGTGLGLPLAKAMLELHGGRLEITSRPQKGTTVTVSFPADRVLTGARVAAA